MAHGISLKLIILLASLNALVAGAIDMYLPAFPAVAAGLGISAAQVQQTLIAFLLGLAAGQGVYGPLLDRYGRRTPLLLGILLFVAGSILAATAQSFEMLLFARFLQAMGAAAGAITPRAIIADTCDTRTSAKAFSILMQITMIAPISAPIIGSLLLKAGPWSLVFWFLAGCGALAGLFGLWLLPETLPVSQRLPISARSIVRNYFKLLSNPQFLLFTLASGCTVGGLFTYISHSPFIFIQHFGISPGHYSLIFAASAAAMIITGQINLRLLRRRQPVQVLYLGLYCFVAAAALLILLSLLQLESVLSYAIILGLCLSMLGMISGNLTALCMSHAGAFTGIASSLMGMMQFFLAGLLGFLASLAPSGLLSLPVFLLGLGCLAIVLCRFAAKKRQPDTNTAAF